jgi:hypothetical protein
MNVKSGHCVAGLAGSNVIFISQAIVPGSTVQSTGEGMKLWRLLGNQGNISTYVLILSSLFYYYFRFQSVKNDRVLMFKNKINIKN